MLVAHRLLAAVPAFLVTLGLFHLMQTLITVEAKLPPEGPPPPWVDIVKVMIHRRPPAPEPPSIRRIALVAPPPLPGMPTTSGKSIVDDTGFTVHAGAPVEDPKRGGRDVGLLVGLDSEAIPLVRVEPDYPAEAARQRREGRVLVEFTIGRTGSVEAARVVAAEPPGVFDREAIEAVRQWKYNPRVEQGRAVDQPGIRTTITFRLDPASS